MKKAKEEVDSDMSATGDLQDELDNIALNAEIEEVVVPYSQLEEERPCLSKTCKHKAWKFNPNCFDVAGSGHESHEGRYDEDSDCCLNLDGNATNESSSPTETDSSCNSLTHESCPKRRKMVRRKLTYGAGGDGAAMRGSTDPSPLVDLQVLDAIENDTNPTPIDRQPKDNGSETFPNTFA